MTPVYPRADQTFVIKGQDFGTQPTDYNSDYLDIVNDTASWISRRATPPPAPVPNPDDFKPITVGISRWTPTEIVVSVFGGAYGKDQWTLNGGDHVTIQVRNPQTGAGPATYEVTVVGAAQNLIAPRINSVSPMLAGADQPIIVIKGLGFGTYPLDGSRSTPYLQISDATGGWSAGRAGIGNTYSVMPKLSRWTNTEIEVAGFDGAFGKGRETLNGGDQIKIKVWNPQTGAGPGTYDTAIVGEGSNLIAPRIIAVTPLYPRADQRIIIKGKGFGIFSPYENNSNPYLQISNETEKWSAGRTGPYDEHSVIMNVSRWTDTEIEVKSFVWAFGPRELKISAGDQIKFQIWNAQTGAGPAVITQQVGPAPN